MYITDYLNRSVKLAVSGCIMIHRLFIVALGLLAVVFCFSELTSAILEHASRQQDDEARRRIVARLESEGWIVDDGSVVLAYGGEERFTNRAVVDVGTHLTDTKDLFLGCHHQNLLPPSVAAISNLQQLEELGLSGCPNLNTVLPALVENRTLRKLTLIDAKPMDKTAFNALMDSDHLTELIFRQPILSDDKVRQLRMRHPSMVIVARAPLP